METMIDNHPAIEQVRETKQIKEVMTLGDCIREGSAFTDQAYSFRDGDKVCALSAALISVKARTDD